MRLILAIFTAHTLPYPAGGSRGTPALPVGPGRGALGRGCGSACSVPPPERTRVRADTSEWTGHPRLGQRDRARLHWFLARTGSAHPVTRRHFDDAEHRGSHSDAPPGKPRELQASLGASPLRRALSLSPLSSAVSSGGRLRPRAHGAATALPARPSLGARRGTEPATRGVLLTSETSSPALPPTSQKPFGKSRSLSASIASLKRAGRPY